MVLPVRVLRLFVEGESGRKGWWCCAEGSVGAGGGGRDMTILRKGGVLLEGGWSEVRRSVSENEGTPKMWPGRLTCFAIRFFRLIRGGAEVLK